MENPRPDHARQASPSSRRRQGAALRVSPPRHRHLLLPELRGRQLPRPANRDPRAGRTLLQVVGNRRIQDHPFELLDGTALELTISLGVHTFDGKVAAGCPSREEVIARADAALYSAKAQGRNRVVLSESRENE